MTESETTQEQIARLCHLAKLIAEMKPWELVPASLVFGVKLPETGENIYIQSTGQNNETWGILAFRGENSLYRVQKASRPEMVVEFDILALSFIPFSKIPPAGRKQTLPASIEINGEKTIPLFSSHLPGYFPSMATAEEASVLEQCLEQVLHVYARGNTQGFLDINENIGSCLYRTNLMGEWVDLTDKVPRNPEGRDKFKLNPKLLRKLWQIPAGKAGMQAELFFFPAAIGDGETRGAVAYLLLMVDEETGKAIHELITPVPTLRKMELSIPDAILGKLIEAGIKPRHLSILEGGKIHSLLQEMGASKLPFPVKTAEELEPLETIFDELWQSVIAGKKEGNKKQKHNKKSTKQETVFQIKVALMGSKMIYRKIAIRSGQTLEELHEAIFEAFDREEEHLYTFFFPSKPTKSKRTIMNSLEFSPPAGDDFFGVNDGGDSTGTTIGQLNLKQKQKFYYLFDWGDEWWHELTFEGEIETKEKKLPKVILKKGDSPPQYPDWDEDEEDEADE